MAPRNRDPGNPVKGVRRPFSGKKSGNSDISVTIGRANYAGVRVKRFCRTFCRSHCIPHFHPKMHRVTTFSVRARVTNLHESLHRRR